MTDVEFIHWLYGYFSMTNDTKFTEKQIDTMMDMMMIVQEHVRETGSIEDLECYRIISMIEGCLMYYPHLDLNAQSNTFTLIKNECVGVVETLSEDKNSFFSLSSPAAEMDEGSGIDVNVEISTEELEKAIVGLDNVNLDGEDLVLEGSHQIQSSKDRNIVFELIEEVSNMLDDLIGDDWDDIKDEVKQIVREETKSAIGDFGESGLTTADLSLTNDVSNEYSWSWNTPSPRGFANLAEGIESVENSFWPEKQEEEEDEVPPEEKEPEEMETFESIETIVDKL